MGFRVRWLSRELLGLSSMKRRKTSSGNTRQRATARRHEDIFALAAINRARREESGYLTSAIAQAEGTTLAFVRRRFPKALFPSRSVERLRVRPADPYPALVEILSESGEALVVTANGSVERELAGRHRAAWLSVLDNRAQASILRQFRGETVGGVKLLWNRETLFDLARGGVVDELDALYISPESSV
jgi:hypothetical protein